MPRHHIALRIEQVGNPSFARRPTLKHPFRAPCQTARHRPRSVRLLLHLVLQLATVVEVVRADAAVLFPCPQAVGSVAESQADVAADIRSQAVGGVIGQRGGRHRRQVAVVIVSVACVGELVVGVVGVARRIAKRGQVVRRVGGISEIEVRLRGVLVGKRPLLMGEAVALIGLIIRVADRRRDLSAEVGFEERRIGRRVAQQVMQRIVSVTWSADLPLHYLRFDSASLLLVR